MSQSLAALPRLGPRSRRLLLVLAAAAGGAGLVVASARWRTPAPAPRPAPEIEWVCALSPAPTPPPPRAELPADADARLAGCLRVWRGDDRPDTAGRFLRDRDVTVAAIHRWIEGEGDPAWVEAGVWWVPLSAEGEPHFPSGLYGGVPLTGPVGAETCRQAIMN